MAAKKLHEKKGLLQNFFGKTKFFGPKNIWVKKVNFFGYKQIFASKNIWAKKNFVKKNPQKLRPPKYWFPKVWSKSGQ